ncbi:hypothetical protein U1Q18_031949 [Sarracenia purpurea var. burkii]
MQCPDDDPLEILENLSAKRRNWKPLELPHMEFQSYRSAISKNFCVLHLNTLLRAVERPRRCSALLA